jgi:hypothetical protein
MIYAFRIGDVVRTNETVPNSLYRNCTGMVSLIRDVENIDLHVITTDDGRNTLRRNCTFRLYQLSLEVDPERLTLMAIKLAEIGL